MVWDLPTRLFHWLLVTCVTGAFISMQIDAMAVHERMGLTVMGLVLFRVIWGFIGHAPSRFVNFVPTPSKLIAYWRNPPHMPPTHNPWGALAVLAFLLVLAMQTLSGSLSTDDVFYKGPLLHLSPFGRDVTSALAGAIHHTGELVIIILVGLHLCALLYHRLAKSEKLVTRMIKGGKDDALSAPSKTKTVTGLILMAACVLACHALPLLRPGF